MSIYQKSVIFKNIFLLAMVFMVLFAGRVSAQETIEGVVNQDSVRQNVLTEVSKQVVFDVSKVDADYENYLEYHWDFGDGGSAEGVGVLHSYLHPGYWEATLVMKKTAEEQKKVYLDVYVYEKLLVGVVDSSVEKEQLSIAEKSVFDSGNLLWILTDEKKNKSTEEFIDLILENKEIVKKTDTIVFWGSGNFGLDLLLQLKQRSEMDLTNYEMVSVSSQSFAGLRKTADSVFNLVNPLSLVLVKENAMEFISGYENVENWTYVLSEEGIGYELIGLKDKFRQQPPSQWLFMSSMINYALFRGVPLATVSLILLMPLIALLLAVARQVVGIKAFGIYVPALITLAFLESGFRYGTIVFLIILVVGTIARLLLKKIRILYLPRMALILTMVALGMLLVMFLAAYFDVVGLKTLSIVPLLTMVILTEKFVSAQIRYGFGEAIKLTLETFVLSGICYLVLSWETLKVLVISYPEAILLVIPFLIILGRWSGLRLTEYWRFRKLLK